MMLSVIKIWLRDNSEIEAITIGQMSKNYKKYISAPHIYLLFGIHSRDSAIEFFVVFLTYVSCHLDKGL